MDDTVEKTRSRSGSETRRKGRMVSVRLTPEEYAELETAAGKYGLTIASLFREKTLRTVRTPPRRKPTLTERELGALKKEVNRVGVNLAQLVKCVHFGETPEGREVRDAAAACRDALAAVREALHGGRAR